MSEKKFVSVILILFSLSSIFCQEEIQKQDYIKVSKNRLVQINQLSNKDDIFKQYSKIIEENFKIVAKGDEPEIIFFKYKNTENLNILEIAAACCLRTDTIATLNRIGDPEENLSGRILILPVVDGLFIPKENGKNFIEIVLQENYENQILTNKGPYYKIDNVDFYFLQGQRFSLTERGYFLVPGLELPVKQQDFWISSEFGKRKNPFSGQIKNHNGIDFACREGTPVYAVGDGIVSCNVKNDSTFGNYIIISHDAGTLTSVYAHLSKSVVENNQKVSKGEIIGYSGKTGMATGPHLHFEIRQNGKAEDPRLKLKINQ